MPTRDNRNHIVPVLLFNAVINSDTNTDSSEFDMADYDGGVDIQAFASAWTDGAYAINIHASDTSGFTPAAGNLLSGDNLIPSGASVSIGAVLAALATPDSIGVISALRYLVVRIVSTATSSGATLMVLAQNKPEIIQEQA